MHIRASSLPGWSGCRFYPIINNNRAEQGCFRVQSLVVMVFVFHRLGTGVTERGLVKLAPVQLSR
ncbi:hypothetical protein AERO9A_320176 [Aeromonas salmonicida]|nr:hypothetical protein AERO9A_320176 [Aeromonas salmonicida]